MRYEEVENHSDERVNGLSHGTSQEGTKPRSTEKEGKSQPPQLDKSDGVIDWQENLDDNFGHLCESPQNAKRLELL